MHCQIRIGTVALLLGVLPLFGQTNDPGLAAPGAASPSSEPLGPCTRRTELVFSEIMHDPAPRADGLNAEFIEIYNSNPWWDDLSGYRLAGKIQYLFPSNTIVPGGGFLVVAAAPAVLAGLYPGLTNLAGPYAGSLKKGGQLQLLDQMGSILLDTTYTNVSPWPAGADGTGHSIVLARPSYGEADPRAWAVSEAVGGSPGAAEAYRPGPLRSVVINEWLAHHDPGNPGYIELYNHSPAPVDISGCVLTDDAATNKFTVPPGAVIGAGSFAAFPESQLGFALNPAGGLILLKNPDGSLVVDAVTYEAQALNASFGRWPDGAAAFYPLASATPGAGNGGIWLGDIAINEIMYKPISGSDDDQYVELYNKGTNTLHLGGWRFTAGIGFEFPPGTTMAPGGYLVVAKNLTNLFAKYPSLSGGNTVGNFSGELPHKGGRLALAMTDSVLTTNNDGTQTTTTIYPVEDEVTFSTGGRWGQWAHGGGSSLELINPNSNHRLAYNWADSDETGKSSWTNLVFTGLLDNGANYNALYSPGPIDITQVGLLDVGEALVDNLVFQAGTNGPNLIENGDFEAGWTGWTAQGDHVRSSIETANGLGGYGSARSLHLRASNRVWTGVNSVQGTLASNTLGDGQTATLRLAGRWLRGSPEVLLRVRGNWIELAGRFPVPANLGTPGLPNSQAIASPGPAIFEVAHSPALPRAGQPVVVTARFHGANGFQPALLYRIDNAVNPFPTYLSVPMLDDGTGGDALAADGVYSASIPAQIGGTVVAFQVRAVDNLTGASSVFPSMLNDNSGLPRECVIGFGDNVPSGSFGQYHVWMTQNWIQRWAALGGVSNEPNDATFADGGGRIIYDMTAFYAGSVGHQSVGSPVTNVIGDMEWKMPEDDLMLGKSDFNKQHTPGNAWLLDETLQKEQTAFWFLRQMGLRWDYRRNYVLFMNGIRHGALMEDTQVPNGDMIDEYWPNDNNGFLYKNHIWWEFDVAQQANGYMNFNQDSCCPFAQYTTTIDGEPGAMKVPRYRWSYWIRQYPDSANNFTNVWALINAANVPTASPAYYPGMEAVADTEEYMRMSAVEHATGDGDNMLGQSQHNMYTYKPLGGKMTLLKWDMNACLGIGWPSDGSKLFAFNPPDTALVGFQTYPPYFRALLRGYKELANGAMLPSRVGPVLDAKFAAYAANGLTAPPYNVVDPGAPGELKDWIETMRGSILLALSQQGVAGGVFTVDGPTNRDSSGLTVNLTGTAPLEVKEITVNGEIMPVTWTTVTAWALPAPLRTTTNLLVIQGLDLQGNPVPGALASITLTDLYVRPPPPETVKINEWMASNKTTLNDPADEKSEDWFELYNPNLTAVDLSGCFLTRSLAQPAAFPIPVGTVVPASGFLLVWADGGLSAAYDGNNHFLHANFKLGKSGGAIGLFDPQTNLVDAVTFGAQASDVSQGRYPDGGNLIYAMNSPTPGNPNNFINSPPSMSPIPDQTLAAGGTLAVTVEAGDPDAPPQTLAFSLLPGAPAGAAIDPVTGVLTWTPPASPVATTNRFTVLVADDGAPPISVWRSFAVMVGAGGTVGTNTVPTPPLMAQSRVAGGQLTVTWGSQAGRMYQLQYKNDLNSTNWTALGGEVAGSGAACSRADSFSPTNSTRFYRVVLLR